MGATDTHLGATGCADTQLADRGTRGSLSCWPPSRTRELSLYLIKVVARLASTDKAQCRHDSAREPQIRCANSVLAVSLGTGKKFGIPRDLCCTAASSEGASTSGREYLAYFLHRHLDFRLPELESLIEYEDKNASFSWRKPFGGCIYSPFWYLTLPSDGFARQLCSRSMLLKVCS